MSTSVKSGRAWVAATVATLFVVLLLAACGLLWEFLARPGHLGASATPTAWSAPTSTGRWRRWVVPGLIGDGRDFGDSIAQLGGGLVPVVVLVFLFTWVAGRAARSGSAAHRPVRRLARHHPRRRPRRAGRLPGLHLAERLQRLRPGLQQFRVVRIETGLYWGALAGLLVGLVAMLAFALEPSERRPSRSTTVRRATWHPSPSRSRPTRRRTHRRRRTREPTPGDAAGDGPRAEPAARLLALTRSDASRFWGCHGRRC